MVASVGPATEKDIQEKISEAFNKVLIYNLQYLGVKTEGRTDSVQALTEVRELDPVEVMKYEKGQWTMSSTCDGG